MRWSSVVRGKSYTGMMFDFEDSQVTAARKEARCGAYALPPSSPLRAAPSLLSLFVPLSFSLSGLSALPLSHVPLLLSSCPLDPLLPPLRSLSCPLWVVCVKCECGFVCVRVVVSLLCVVCFLRVFLFLCFLSCKL